MATAEYGYAYDKLERSGSNLSAQEGITGLLVLQFGRDSFGIGGDLNTPDEATLADVTGTIDYFSWRNINSSESVRESFLTIENATVDYQDFVINTAFDISLFFGGDDDIIGSDENDFIFGQFSAGPGNDILHLNAGNDLVDAGPGNDMVHGGTGDDFLMGGAGRDIARFEGAQNNFTLTLSANSTSITDRSGNQGQDTLVDFETLEFVDAGGIITFDLATFSGLAQLSTAALNSFVELYIAYFNRAPDALGLNFWGSAYANGTSLSEIAALFVTQDETQATYPEDMTIEAFATAVYENVLGRIPDADGFAFWVDALTSAVVSRDQFILSVLEGAKAEPPAGASAAFIAQQAADQAYLAAKTQIGTYFAVDRGLSDVDAASAVMSLYAGAQTDVADVLSIVDFYHTQALDPENGAFLLQTVGISDQTDLL